MDVVENEVRLWQSSCCAAGELNQPFCTCHPVCQVRFFPPCAGPVTSPPAKLLHGSCIQRMSSEPKSTVYFFRLKVQKAFTALVGDWPHVLKVLSFGTWCFDRFFFLRLKVSTICCTVHVTWCWLQVHKLEEGFEKISRKPAFGGHLKVPRSNCFPFYFSTSVSLLKFDRPPKKTQQLFTMVLLSFYSLL